MLMALALLLSAQDAPPFPKSGPEHEVLKQLVGDWEYTAKFQMEPGQDSTSRGKETVRLIAGGLFIVFDSEGEMFGGKFVGHGTMGYDVVKKKYTGTWMDNMATGVYLVEATYDEKTKTFTETMEGSNPQTGETMKMKMTSEIKDKDKRVLRFYMPGADGKEFESGSIEYTRKK
jgi:hypothetical protein